MSIEELAETAQALVASGKGILAIDASTAAIGQRFASVGIENTEANRRAYHELLLTTPKLSQHLSGVILSEETLRESTKDSMPLAKAMTKQGVIPGVKVDKGTTALAGCPGELVTEGLDGLRERLKEDYKLGARFATWRAVITIGEDIPSGICIEANAHALARFAALCQEQGLVAMVEPEVLMEGDHDIQVCYEVTEATLRALFGALHEQGVLLEGTLLKVSMVLPGKECDEQADVEEIAESTLMCLKSTVPAILPGIVFLPGEQSEQAFTAHLDAMNRIGNLPWPLSFSHGPAQQQAVLQAWSKDTKSPAPKVQALAFEWAKANSLAAQGKWEG